MIQSSIYIAWFIYIFGILGHVCPVAFLGIWTASLSLCVGFSGRRPRFIGTIFALLITCAAWGLAFFVFHPVKYVVFVN